VNYYADHKTYVANLHDHKKNKLPDLAALPTHLALFAKYFIQLESLSSLNYWRKLCRQSEQQHEQGLLSSTSLLFDSLNVKSPSKWVLTSMRERPYYGFCINQDEPVKVVYRNRMFSMSFHAALLSPYMREYLSRRQHGIVDLTWIDGEAHHVEKLIKFLEYHVHHPMPHIPTPVRNRNLKKVVPKWYAKFALECDRKDCFVMILIGNGLAISPLVHLFCARIATMIKSLRPEEMREIMAFDTAAQMDGHDDMSTDEFFMN